MGNHSTRETDRGSISSETERPPEDQDYSKSPSQQHRPQEPPPPPPEQPQKPTTQPPVRPQKAPPSPPEKQSSEQPPKPAPEPPVRPQEAPPPPPDRSSKFIHQSLERPVMAPPSPPGRLLKASQSLPKVQSTLTLRAVQEEDEEEETGAMSLPLDHIPERKSFERGKRPSQRPPNPPTLLDPITEEYPMEMEGAVALPLSSGFERMQEELLIIQKGTSSMKLEETVGLPSAPRKMTSEWELPHEQSQRSPRKLEMTSGLPSPSKKGKFVGELSSGRRSPTVEEGAVGLPSSPRRAQFREESWYRHSRRSPTEAEGAVGFSSSPRRIREESWYAHSRRSPVEAEGAVGLPSSPRRMQFREESWSEHSRISPTEVEGPSGLPSPPIRLKYREGRPRQGAVICPSPPRILEYREELRPEQTQRPKTKTEEAVDFPFSPKKEELVSKQTQKSSAETEGAAALRPTSETKKVEKVSTAEETLSSSEHGEGGGEEAAASAALPSTSQAEQQTQEQPNSMDVSMLAEVGSFVYHEPDLILHIRDTVQDIAKIAGNIESTKASILQSTSELVQTYKKTEKFFRSKDQRDETVARAIKKLEDNVHLQEMVTEGFVSAASNIHCAVSKLNREVEQMTKEVIAKFPKPVRPKLIT